MLEFIMRWKCDSCESEVDRSTYGLPNGYIWYFNGYTTVHACLDCKAKYSIKSNSRRDDMRILNGEVR